MGRADVNEVNVDAVDPGYELRQSIELGFRLAPVVAGAPMLDERLELRELDALRLVSNRLLVGPPCRRDPAAEIIEPLVWNVDAEGADCGVFGRCPLCVGLAATCVGSRPRAPAATEVATIAAAEVANRDIINLLAGVARLLQVNGVTHDDEPLSCGPDDSRQ
jgi:hypothetical protein